MNVEFNNVSIYLTELEILAALLLYDGVCTAEHGRNSTMHSEVAVQGQRHARKPSTFSDHAIVTLILNSGKAKGKSHIDLMIQLTIKCTSLSHIHRVILIKCQQCSWTGPAELWSAGLWGGWGRDPPPGTESVRPVTTPPRPFRLTWQEERFEWLETSVQLSNEASALVRQPCGV